MPCTKCENGKYKWGENGECKYDSKDACEKANPNHYKKSKITKIVELIIADSNQEMTIDAISLVTNPAIEQDFVYMKKHKNNLTFAKIDEEKRMVISPALIPNKQIFRHDPNTDSDYYVYFSVDTIKKASELYLKHNNHHSATYQHEEDVKGILTTESWIKSGDQDKSNLYGYDLPIGTWFVTMRIDNDEMWQKIKDGELRGISIEGYFIDKMEKMGKQELANKEIMKKPTDHEILSAFNELIQEKKIDLAATKISLGIADDVEKLTQQAKNLIPDLTKDVNAIKESEKNIVKENKLLIKQKSVLEKAENKKRELAKDFERATDNEKTAEREFKQSERTLKSSKDSIDFLNKRLNKTKAKASKTRTNLEKKLNTLEKAAKDLGVKIPTGEASKVLRKLISLL